MLHASVNFVPTCKTLVQLPIPLDADIHSRLPFSDRPSTCRRSDASIPNLPLRKSVHERSARRTPIVPYPVPYLLLCDLLLFVPPTFQYLEPSFQYLPDIIKYLCSEREREGAGERSICGDWISRYALHFTLPSFGTHCTDE